MEPTVNDGFVYTLRRQAQRLGFSSPKIEQRLDTKQAVCCRQYSTSDVRVASARNGDVAKQGFVPFFASIAMPSSPLWVL
jgi:hypothetical protein